MESIPLLRGSSVRPAEVYQPHAVSGGDAICNRGNGFPRNISGHDIPFVREARSGAWRDSLSTIAARTIEQAWGQTMKELVTSSSSPDIMDCGEQHPGISPTLFPDRLPISLSSGQPSNVRREQRRYLRAIFLREHEARQKYGSSQEGSHSRRFVYESARHEKSIIVTFPRTRCEESIRGFHSAADGKPGSTPCRSPMWSRQ